MGHRKRIHLQQDVLDLAPSDTGCRAATLEACLRQLLRYVEEEEATGSFRRSAVRKRVPLLDAKRECEEVLELVYGSEPASRAGASGATKYSLSKEAGRGLGVQAIHLEMGPAAGELVGQAEQQLREWLKVISRRETEGSGD